MNLELFAEMVGKSVGKAMERHLPLMCGRHEAIADLLLAIYGDDALKLFDQLSSDDSCKHAEGHESFAEWQPDKHPRAAKGTKGGGRFIERNSQEAVAATKEKIHAALKAPASVEGMADLLNHVNLLTVAQIHQLKKEHGIKGSGKNRDELVKKIADRLHRGRREEAEKEPEKKPKEEKAAGPWHGNREDVFSAMRDLGKRTQHEHEQARKLGPRGGTVSIGSADFDHTLKATVGDAYLRALRQGKTPDEALTAAKADGADAIKKWNEKGSKSRATFTGVHELKRWEGAAEDIADSIHRRFTQDTTAKAAPGRREEPAKKDEEKPATQPPQPKAEKPAGAKGEDKAGANKPSHQGGPQLIDEKSSRRDLEAAIVGDGDLYKQFDEKKLLDGKYTDAEYLAKIRDWIEQGDETHQSAKPSVKATHEMTRGEHGEQNRQRAIQKNGKAWTDGRWDSSGGMKFQFGLQHRQAVASALAAGKPVPSEVLADYPDLAP